MVQARGTQIVRPRVGPDDPPRQRRKVGSKGEDAIRSLVRDGCSLEGFDDFDAELPALHTVVFCEAPLAQERVELGLDVACLQEILNGTDEIGALLELSANAAQGKFGARGHFSLGGHEGGGIGDLHPVAEKVGEDFGVG